MSRFLTPLKLEYQIRYDDISAFWLISDFRYYSEILGRDVIVSEGFSTDLATIPMAFRNIVDNNENFVFEASIIHDWLYTSREVDRATADKVFREAMYARKGKPWKVELVYKMVRLFGWLYY